MNNFTKWGAVTVTALTLANSKPVEAQATTPPICTQEVYDDQNGFESQTQHSVELTNKIAELKELGFRPHVGVNTKDLRFIPNYDSIDTSIKKICKTWINRGITDPNLFALIVFTNTGIGPKVYANFGTHMPTVSKSTTKYISDTLIKPAIIQQGTTYNADHALALGIAEYIKFYKEKTTPKPSTPAVIELPETQEQIDERNKLLGGWALYGVLLSSLIALTIGGVKNYSDHKLLLSQKKDIATIVETNNQLLNDLKNKTEQAKKLFVQIMPQLDPATEQHYGTRVEEVASTYTYVYSEHSTTNNLKQIELPTKLKALKVLGSQILREQNTTEQLYSDLAELQSRLETYPELQQSTDQLKAKLQTAITDLERNHFVVNQSTLNKTLSEITNLEQKIISSSFTTTKIEFQNTRADLINQLQDEINQINQRLFAINELKKNTDLEITILDHNLTEYTAVYNDFWRDFSSDLKKQGIESTHDITSKVAELKHIFQNILQLWKEGETNQVLDVYDQYTRLHKSVVLELARIQKIYSQITEIATGLPLRMAELHTQIKQTEHRSNSVENTSAKHQIQTNLTNLTKQATQALTQPAVTSQSSELENLFVELQKIDHKIKSEISDQEEAESRRKDDERRSHEQSVSISSYSSSSDSSSSSSYSDSSSSSSNSSSGGLD
jgi:hypothetical protein